MDWNSLVSRKFLHLFLCLQILLRPLKFCLQPKDTKKLRELLTFVTQADKNAVEYTYI